MIGVFGGTFDPVHRGHITMATELQQHLQLEQMRLLPCGTPAHRAAPIASAKDRLHMLCLAIEGTALVVDERELQRVGPSYTYDSLQSLREELGTEKALCLCMGADAFSTLLSWHQWADFLKLTHIVIVTRPGVNHQWPQELKTLLADKQTTDPVQLRKRPMGLIYLAQLSQIPLSSTRVRHTLTAGKPASHAIHPKVQQYIEEQGLYKHP